MHRLALILKLNPLLCIDLSKQEGKEILSSRLLVHSLYALNGWVRDGLEAGRQELIPGSIKGDRNPVSWAITIPSHGLYGLQEAELDVQPWYFWGINFLTSFVTAK